jgi:hypothetical protein
VTLRPVLTQEAAFIADMKAKYAADADVLRIINYYDAARSVVLKRDARDEERMWELRSAAFAFHDALRKIKARALHHKTQRKLWQRRAKAVYRLQHGRPPTVAELDACVTKDWKS